MRSARLAVVALLLCACGGHSANEGPSSPGEATQAGAAGEGSELQGGMSGAGATAGEPSTAGGAPSNASGAGGAPDPVGYDSLIASGTRSCQNEDYCFGLSCYAPPSFEPTVCLAPCSSDLDCNPSEACLRSPGLEGSCFARCDSPVDCYYGFSCFDFARDGQFVCFPAPWIGRRDELGY